jgi:hypothetical protein
MHMARLATLPCYTYVSYMIIEKEPLLRKRNPGAGKTLSQEVQSGKCKFVHDCEE